MANAKPESVPAPAAPPTKQGKDASAMLNLFQTEVAEESSLGKFAGALKDIEAVDLLAEARKVLNQLRGTRD